MNNREARIKEAGDQLYSVVTSIQLAAYNMVYSNRSPFYTDSFNSAITKQTELIIELQKLGLSASEIAEIQKEFKCSTTS